MTDKRFRAAIQKDKVKGGWTYVKWPDSAEFLGTRKAVKVRGTIDGHEFEATFLPMGDGSHMLPIRASILKAIKKQANDTVEVRVMKRPESPAQ